jgi:hypothetical protein
VEDRVNPARACVALVLLPLGLGSFLSCGGGTSNPSSPSSPTPPPITLAPQATPTPPTPPTEAGLPRSCQGTPTGSLKNCGKRPDPQLRSLVNQVVESLRGRADIFYPEGNTIRHLETYRQAVISGLDALGVCAIFDYGNGIGDQVYVRTPDNSFSEAYDVIAGAGQAWTGYENSCEPAASQPSLDPGYPNQDPSCKLPPSGASFCLDFRFGGDYADDVRSAIVAVTNERPDLFDLHDTLASELTYRLTDPAGYIQAVIGKLRAKGYCAIEDEELMVKKDNSVTENFDIVRTPRPDAQYSMFTYKGRCHAAGF